jgi:hypothetical protein
MAGDLASEPAMWAWVLAVGGLKGVAMEYALIGMGEQTTVVDTPAKRCTWMSS